MSIKWNVPSHWNARETDLTHVCGFWWVAPQREERGIATGTKRALQPRVHRETRAAGGTWGRPRTVLLLTREALSTLRKTFVIIHHCDLWPDRKYNPYLLPTHNFGPGGLRCGRMERHCLVPSLPVFPCGRPNVSFFRPLVRTTLPRAIRGENGAPADGDGPTQSKQRPARF